MKGAKDGYGAARKTESEKKAELRAVQEKLKAAFTVLEEMGAKRDEEGGGVNALFEQKKALHEAVSSRDRSNGYKALTAGGDNPSPSSGEDETGEWSGSMKRPTHIHYLVGGRKKKLLRRFRVKVWCVAASVMGKECSEKTKSGATFVSD